jgi:hypothetical protein
MKKTIWFALVILLLAAPAAKAQSAFSGTWKLDRNSLQLPKKPIVYLLQNGVWNCKSCDPPIKVKADGRDYPIATDYSCVQTTNVKVIDDHTILITDRKNGRITEAQRGTVSPDGNTLTYHAKATCDTSGEPQSWELEETRLAKGPAGAHLISGSWRMTKLNQSQSAGVLTMKVQGDTVSYSDATGTVFSAKLGGPSVLVKSSPSHATVSVKMIGKNTMLQTYYLKGKLSETDRCTLDPDGKRMNIVTNNVTVGKTSYVFVKQ